MLNSSSQAIFRLENTSSLLSTPRSKLKHTKSWVSIDVIQLEIQRCMKEIEDINFENAKARQNCSEREREISAIVKALDKNMDFFTETIDSISEENQEIKEKIEIQNELIWKIKILYEKLVNSNTTFDENCGLDFDFLTSISDSHASFSSNNHHEITLKQYAHETPYFHNCHSKEEFIDRCLQLNRDVDAIRNKKPNYNNQLKKYAEKIRELKQQHDAIHANLAREISQFSHEKDKLERQIKSMKARNEIEKSSSLIQSRNIDVASATIRKKRSCDFENELYQINEKLRRTPKTTQKIRSKQPDILSSLEFRTPSVLEKKIRLD
ncbi:hypothetical protein TRFO_23745 [Tritrichomonas foetus]|uniref:Uncharacterized protein n=1 Tax=Tritrichomonas foetus TaxID=1144522 RepID=A0A1J4K8Q5_9EUKA|nr:hypothetical protein TRFO_23745 [Tritrichomonas foetus]|eukprot:OHT07881.1 hypothetical protein TRFO_23745 [Tritrichomonas foetus]